MTKYLSLLKMSNYPKKMFLKKEKIRDNNFPYLIVIFIVLFDAL